MPLGKRLRLTEKGSEKVHVPHAVGKAKATSSRPQSRSDAALPRAASQAREGASGTAGGETAGQWLEPKGLKRPTTHRQGTNHQRKRAVPKGLKTGDSETEVSSDGSEEEDWGRYDLNRSITTLRKLLDHGRDVWLMLRVKELEALEVVLKAVEQGAGQARPQAQSNDYALAVRGTKRKKHPIDPRALEICKYCHQETVMPGRPHTMCGCEEHVARRPSTGQVPSMVDVEHMIH